MSFNLFPRLRRAGIAALFCATIAIASALPHRQLLDLFTPAPSPAAANVIVIPPEYPAAPSPNSWAQRKVGSSAKDARLDGI